VLGDIRVIFISPDKPNAGVTAPFLPPGLNHDEMMRRHVEQVVRPPRWPAGFYRNAEIANMALVEASSHRGNFTLTGVTRVHA
jgi:hypothetical protein